MDCGCTSTASFVGLDREQMMRLDQFQDLVEHGRGIDGDLGTHRPVRMLERLLERGGPHRLARPGAERTAGRGDHDAADVLARPRGQRLEDRVVLGIDRQHVRAMGGSGAHEHAAGANQTFLVGERDGRAALDRGERGLQSDRAADRRHHPIRRPLRRLDHGGLAARSLDAGAGQRVLELAIGRRIGHDRKARVQLARDLRQIRGILVGGHRLDAIFAVAALEQIDGAHSDRAGCARAP